MFASLFSLSFPFNDCYGCDYLWFRFFINSVLAYVHVLHIYCLIISLNWYFVNWGLNVQGCFTHILNIQAHIASMMSSLIWVITLFATSDIFRTCLWVAVLLDASVLLLGSPQLEVPSTLVIA